MSAADPPPNPEDVDALRKQIEQLQLQQKQLEARLSQQQPTHCTLRDSSPFAEPDPSPKATPPSPPSPASSLTSFPVADSQGQHNKVVWPHDEQGSRCQSESSSQESSLKEGSKLVAKGLRAAMKGTVKAWFTLADKADEYAASTKAERRARP